MNAKKWCDMLCGVHEDYRHINLGLLLFRVVLGIAFIFHGWSKVGDMQGALMMLGSFGVPAWLAYIAAYTEFLGGVALIFGIATRFAGIMLTIFMVVAIYLVHLSKGYSMMNGGYEYQLLLLSGVIFIGLVGPGKYSLHHSFCKGKH